MLHILRPPSQHSIQRGAAIAVNTTVQQKSSCLMQKKTSDTQSTSKDSPCSSSQVRGGTAALHESQRPVCRSKVTVPGAFLSNTVTSSPQHYPPRLLQQQRTELSQKEPATRHNPTHSSSSPRVWLPNLLPSLPLLQRTAPPALQSHPPRSPPSVPQVPPTSPVWQNLRAAVPPPRR